MRDLTELKTADNLKDYADKHLERKGHFYRCPLCKTYHLSIDGNAGLFHCFYSPKNGTEDCPASGSVIDLIKYVEGLRDDKEAIRRTRELYDPTYSTYWNGGAVPQKSAKPVSNEKKEGTKSMDDKDIIRNFKKYYKKCHKRIMDTDYPRRRGLDEKTVNRFNLGFDPEWTSPTAEYNRKQKNKELAREGKPALPPLTPSPRLIIPLSANNYLARDTRQDDELTEDQKTFKKMNEGKNKPFFNIREAVKNPLCFFIVEGELDCISIEQAGGSCFALGSTVKAKSCCEEMKKTLEALQINVDDAGTVIIGLDNDDAGRKASETIEEACNIAGFECVKLNVAGQYKDANEYLCKDKNGFYNTIQGIIASLRKEKMEDYAKYNSATAVSEFMSRGETAGKPVPTGFKKLDDLLNGGLCSGLVFIGGLSSIGKTTIALNIAEQMATNQYPAGTQEVIKGRDVLYFALEQGKFDLISKILSRRTYLESRRKKNKKLAKMNFQILQRDRWNEWSQEEQSCLWGCYEAYEKEVGENLYIIEPKGDMTALDIVKMTERHIAYTNRVPIIFVDYLQILKSIDVKATDKQAVDRTIVALGSLARRHNTTVVGISSFNRENYWQKVNLTAFKDTGNLEYSADMLFAIAPAGMKDGTTDDVKTSNKKLVEVCKDAMEKDIQFHVLKTRSGIITGTRHQLFFTYHAQYNHFEETDGPSDLVDPFRSGNPAVKGKLI